MGKAARWLRGLFGMKRPDPNPNPNPHPNSSKPVKNKSNKWSFVKSYREKSTVGAASTVSYVGPTMCVDDARKHATSVASTSSFVGPAMGVDDASKHAIDVAAVQRDVWAAVVIQSCFRRYLARRALRALKGLVKLQALVRGHIMRNKTKETMRCMQAMLRAQARARSFRTSIPESPHSSNKLSQNPHPGPPTPEKFELVHAKYAKLDQTPKIRRNCSRISWSNIVNSDDERAERILEVDPGKPLHNMRRTNLFESSHSGLLTSDHITQSYTTSKDSTHQTNPSPVSCEVVQSLNPLKLIQQLEDSSYCTPENTPQLYLGGSHSGGSVRGPFTPAKSDGSRSFLSGYSDWPSYMGYTESARAKMRSHSAPKQRPQYDKASSTKRHTVHGSHTQSGSAIQASFARKAYPGSGRLDRLGMPVRDSTVVYYSGYLN